jgi:hypothetical protein
MRELERSPDIKETINLLSQYYHISRSATIVYIKALRRGSLTQDETVTEKVLNELREKNLIYEPVSGTEIYLPKSPTEQLLPQILAKLDEIKKVGEYTENEWIVRQRNQVGTILKIIEGQESVDRAVFNLIKNSPTGSDIKLCVRSLSPLGDPEDSAEAIKIRDLTIKVILISEETSSYYKKAITRLKELRAHGITKERLQVKSLPGNQEFRYMVARNKVVFVTGHREKGMFAEDPEIAKWFERIFDGDWNNERARLTPESPLMGIQRTKEKFESLLDDKLALKYHRVKEDKILIDLLKSIRTIFPSFTCHGPEHSEQIIKNLEWIIPKSEWAKFSPLEAFLLLSSAWIHDVGMSDFKHELRPRYSYKKRKEKTDILRKNHPERSRRYINDKDNRQRLGLEEPIASLIGMICNAHSGSYDIGKLKKKFGGDFGPIEGYEKYNQVRLQLLAALLRLADACDLNYERATETLITIGKLDKVYATSEPHLEGALSIAGVCPKGREIGVYMTANEKKGQEWAILLVRHLQEDFKSVEKFLKDKENGITIPYDNVIIENAEDRNSKT